MHVPHASLSSTAVPATLVGAGLHHLINYSWDILLPYTLLGGVFMAYGQYKLTRGERVMHRVIEQTQSDTNILR